MRGTKCANRKPAWLRYDAAARRLLLALHVQPNARRSEIAGLHGGALKVKIGAPATDNRANVELVEYLSEILAIPKSAITIRHGTTSRRKLVEIRGGPELVTKIAALEEAGS
jgi:hypothetical protein